MGKKNPSSQAICSHSVSQTPGGPGTTGWGSPVELRWLKKLLESPVFQRSLSFYEVTKPFENLMKVPCRLS